MWPGRPAPKREPEPPKEKVLPATGKTGPEPAGGFGLGFGLGLGFAVLGFGFGLAVFGFLGFAFGFFGFGLVCRRLAGFGAAPPFSVTAPSSPSGSAPPELAREIAGCK